MLSGWCSSRHDHHPQYLALRSQEKALPFYTTLSSEHQNDYDLLVNALKQNYTTNPDVLKACLKALKQQPEQDIATFLCDIRTLARRAHRNHPHLIDRIVLTSFKEGWKNSVLGGNCGKRNRQQRTKPSLWLLSATLFPLSSAKTMPQRKLQGPVVSTMFQQAILRGTLSTNLFEHYASKSKS